MRLPRRVVWDVLQVTGAKGQVVRGLAKGNSPTGNSEMERTRGRSGVMVTNDCTKAT